LSNLVEGMLVGRVDLGGSFQACPANYSVTEDAMARSIVRLECEAEELRATIALLEAERDLLRVQVRAGEGLGMALVNSINKLKEEKAELTVKLVNLQGRSRPATLDEISESVREKYDERYEAEEIEN
jgi:class 3 adenylate cyclase